MKQINKMITLLLLVALVACGSDEEPTPSRDELVFVNQYFISAEPTASSPDRWTVVQFGESGSLRFFAVDASDEIVGGVVSSGVYRLDYPKITDISPLFDETATTILKDGLSLYFVIDGMRYDQTLTRYE